MGSGDGSVLEAAAGPALVTRRRPSLGDRERFLLFALTAAELLLEVGADGRIGFAAGAFARRLGRPPEHWVGRRAQELILPACRPAFLDALALLDARDRLPPTTFRLADADGTPMAVAGLRVDATPLAAEADDRHGGGRRCLTFSAIPLAAAAAASPPGAAHAAMPDAHGLRRAIEAGLREDASPSPPGTLALLELAGPDGPLAPRPELAGRIAAALSAAVAADGGLAGELSAGRYGLVAHGGGAAAADLARIAGEIEALAREAGLQGARATGTTLALDQAERGLSPMQATRALRYALGAFARGGPGALEEAGFAGGLPGFVAQACDRAGALRRIIAERRFRLAFQPIVSLADRRPHHFEALLRLRDSPGGPQEFVTFAETVGLSEDLDWAVVETCAEAARKAVGARIACNLSGLSLQSAAFRDRLLDLLRGEPALVPRLLIEITEAAEIEDEAEAVRSVEALRALGLPLCIDDFGAGAAAFRYLRAFRADYVKIDGHYVQAALRSEQDRGFLAAMVELARNVGAKVVAERIETEAEAQAMAELGVAYGQGWLFGRPGRLPGSL
jgi:EAL domain-containing protein (putative c-di-GMP-specific phosphodiesterase class I)